MASKKHLFIAIDKITGETYSYDACIIGSTTYEGCRNLLRYALTRAKLSSEMERYEIVRFAEYVVDEITRQTPISDCGFSTRVQNCLVAEDIKTVGALIKKRRLDLMKVPNFGEESFKEILSFLVKNGFYLQG